MRGRTLAPGGFRLRSRSNSAAPKPTFNDILFPRVYEDAWGSDVGHTERSDIERARIFLLRFSNMNPDPFVKNEVRAIVSDQQNRTIPALAAAVQSRIFRNRHATFAATPLLQCVRFMLLKGRVLDAIYSERTKQVFDFFFDPALARNIEPPPSPEDAVIYQYPAARLKVAIIGGGPTALASAISLAERGAGKVEVHMYERRWVQMVGPNGPYVDYPPTARRRDQVVTLQDSVTTLMSKGSQDALFEGRPERVWPGSANIQIRKVEDRFLKRCQSEEFRGLIHLHCQGMTREELQAVGDFHVLLGADGAASWVRKSYFHGYEKERGRSYALGLAFDRPAGLPWSQPLNVFLTLGQTRYLLNASDYDGRGYLNMQLTEEEWHQMVSVDGQPVHFGRPGCLRRSDGSIPEGFEESQVFAPSEDRESMIWKAIEDGLKLFGFKESEVINIVRIPIVVQAVREGVQMLPVEDSRSISRPHALVAVAGDAAMTVHFWPGRGLNSGIKSGMALGDELVHALNNGRFIGMPLDAMKEYNDFIMKLQGREHDKRSIPILNQSGSPEMLGWLLSKASSVPDNVAIEWLVGAMSQIAERLEKRADWAYEPVANVEPQLRIVLRQMTSMTLREMAVSFPWPTREMAGAEVLPIRSMKPEEKQKWLQSLFSLLRDEKGKDSNGRTSSKPDGEGARSRASSSARFEVPRGLSPGRMESTLRRSNAARSPSPSPARFEQALTIPSEDDAPSWPSSRGGSEMNLVRMLSVNQRPGKAVLSEAMSLALFRVDEN
jgi:2-polyprenyl-6-methoxyphenol hydroxylase-like FAD-dependent oxidoreductase